MNKKFQDIKASLGDADKDDYESSIPPKKDSKSDTPILDNFSRDITKLAEEGALDPIIGRENEINRVCQILARRKKNNPVLLGEPGCVNENTIITVRKISNVNKHNIVNK